MMRLCGTIFVLLALALVALFLVVDFGEWLRIYAGKPVEDVARLYWFRSHLALVQFAPAAIALSGGLAVTVVRRRGEWTALKALGASPTQLVRPVAVVALVAALGLLAFQEFVVSQSGPAADRMMVERFDRWGDFLVVYSPRRWFRAGPWFVNVRGDVATLADVRLFEVQNGQLARWLEGERLVRVGEGSWRLEKATELTFAGPSVTGSRAGDFELSLPLRPEITQLAVGRPEWLPVATLAGQVGVMSALQLPTEATRFAIHQRWASGLAAVLAAVLTALLALSGRARPSVAMAIVSGGALYGALFVGAMISRSLALNGRLPPSLAAWVVPVVLLGACSLLARRVWRLA